MTMVSRVAFLAGITTLLTVLGAYFYQKKKKETLPKKWEEVGFIKHIYLYPLRGSHKVEMAKVECTQSGLKQTKDGERAFQLRDRFLVIFSEREHEVRTSRTYPKLLLIDVSVHDSNHLAIDAPTMRTLYVKIPTNDGGDEITIKFNSGEKLETFDCGDEAALWFSRYILEKDGGLRLGYNAGNTQCNLSETGNTLMEYYKQLTSKTMSLDSCLTCVTLVNHSSVNDLINRLGNCSVTIDNFKANLVVGGEALAPYCEDEWQWVKIGDVVFKNTTNSMQCADSFATNGNGALSIRKESLKIIHKCSTNNGPKEPPLLGINLQMLKTGCISIGEKVFISKDQ